MENGKKKKKAVCVARSTLKIRWEMADLKRIVKAPASSWREEIRSCRRDKPVDERRSADQSSAVKAAVELRENLRA